MEKNSIYSWCLVLFFLFASVNLSFSQNDTGVDGLAIGSEQDNTYSALVIRGANKPLHEESKRDIIFSFKNAGKSAIRSYRSGWYGTYLQFLTSQDTAAVSLRPRMHIDSFGKVGIGTTNPLKELDVNGGIRAKGIETDGLKLNGDLQFMGDIPVGNWGHHFWFSNLGDNSDPVFIARYNAAADASELRVSLGDTPDKRDKFSIGSIEWSNYKFTPMFTVQANGMVGIKTNDPQKELDVNGTIRGKNLLITDGNVGIGTDNPQNKLDVKGTIRADEIIVSSEWSDFVFKKGYILPTLEEVEQHIDEKGTLPGVPSEKEIKANGANLAETNALLLQKIEELTLYMIEMKKEIKELKDNQKNNCF